MKEKSNLKELMQSLYQSWGFYISLERNEDNEDYWGEITDPDGLVRNRFEERDMYLKDIDYIMEYIESLDGTDILDVGCGAGWMLSELSDKWNKYGIEPDKNGYEESKKHGNIVHGTLENHKYEDDSFDLIVMHHVIEHVERPERVMKEVKRILRDGGILIIATPDFDSGCARLFGSKYRMLHDKTHVSLFSNDSMHRMLRAFGFEITRTEYPYFDTRFFTKENLERMMDNSKVSPPFYGNWMTFFCRNHK